MGMTPFSQQIDSGAVLKKDRMKKELNTKGGRKTWDLPLEIDVKSLVIGDMPGDKLNISQSHIDRARVCMNLLAETLIESGREKTVISIYGGSGTGKSEVASVLAYYCNFLGKSTYIVSGDNYPYRIPEENDRERLRVFRQGGLEAVIKSPSFTSDWMNELKDLWKGSNDFDIEALGKIDELLGELYLNGGKASLRGYLGTNQEIDFFLINNVIKTYKNHSPRVMLKRMGRGPHDISFPTIDVSHTDILIVEWTHGNNPLLGGIDYPIYLHSTPQQTLEHRITRARDRDVESKFSNLVLDLEQEKLLSQVKKAKYIISQSAAVMDPLDVLSGGEG